MGLPHKKFYIEGVAAWTASKERSIVSVDTKINITRRSTWIRLIYMSLFVAIFGITELVLIVIVAVQFAFKLVVGKEIGRLAEFGADFGDYFRAIVLFLTYHTETMPYPFGEWPTVKESGRDLGEKGADKSSVAEAAASNPKRTRKRTARRKGGVAGSSD
jgi:hypothetical protein